MMTFVKWLVRAFVFLLVLAAIAYPVADWMRAPMDDAARAELKHSGKADQFVPLSAGVMHVRVQGPADGPVVLMVHGASTGGFAFHDWIKPLSEAGYRVIVPDLFGYGYSDRPDATHDQQFFMDQLNELLQKQNVAAPFHIVGTSMGGAIVTDFVAANPSRIRSVTLIAPAGLGRVEAANSLSTQLFLAPIIGDWIARVFGPAIMVNGVTQGYSAANGGDAVAAWMNEQAKYRGYAEGQQNTFRHYDFLDRRTSYEALGRSGLPVLAIWGTADTTVPFAMSKELLARAPQTKLVPIEGKPHGLPLREPTTLVALVLPFLSEHAQSPDGYGQAPGPAH